MRYNKKIILVFTLGLIVILVSTCLSNTSNPIIKQLSALRGKGILFGHQDDLAYGIGWNGLSDDSDVKRVTGDFPALFGWELGGIELNQSSNLDSVPFESIKKLAIKAHAMGGINTFSWHPYSPVKNISAWAKDSVVVKDIIPGGALHEDFKKQLDIIASFFSSLKDENGVAIPFIFRPWHEMDGTWFWWGQQGCSSNELKSLFRFTVEYLRANKGLKMMVVAYSPDKHYSDVQSYLTWYPGDDIVDIVGTDNYYDFTKPDGVDTVIKKLRIVIEVANSKSKLAAFTETGSSCLPDSTWFTSKLSAVLNDSIVKRNISYVMVWRNASIDQFYFPYPSHSSVTDALNFIDRDDILLLNDFNKIK